MRVFEKKHGKARKTAALVAVFFSLLTVPGGTTFGQGLARLDQEISRVVENISEAVVRVEARMQNTRGSFVGGQANRLTDPVTAMVGSGLLVDTLGHVLTVLSLVDGCDEFLVGYKDQNFDAKLVGVDRGYNLAALKIEAPVDHYVDVSPIPPFPGRLALAFGRAAGGAGYPSLGIIAGRQGDGSFLVSGSVIPGLLGGGVFDLSGKLLGMISSGSIPVSDDRRSSWEGIVMIPATTVSAAGDRIICCGNREAGYLGVKTTAIELVSAASKVLGDAVVIAEVEPRSPAEMAGLRPGDIITRFGLRDISSDRQLQRLVSSAGSDSAVAIDYMRGGQRFTVTVQLAALSRNRDQIVPSASSLRPDEKKRLLTELQRQIDAMRTEMNRLQRELDRLQGLPNTTR